MRLLDIITYLSIILPLFHLVLFPLAQCKVLTFFSFHFVSTTGARDPITSTFHIVLGKRVSLDVAQVVRWKTTSTSKVEPFVRYAASFAG